MVHDIIFEAVWDVFDLINHSLDKPRSWEPKKGIIGTDPVVYLFSFFFNCLIAWNVLVPFVDIEMIPMPWNVPFPVKVLRFIIHVIGCVLLENLFVLWNYHLQLDYHLQLNWNFTKMIINSQNMVECDFLIFISLPNLDVLPIKKRAWSAKSTASVVSIVSSSSVSSSQENPSSGFSTSGVIATWSSTDSVPRAFSA